MIHEDITISGSFQASGSFILPRIPSNSLATATTGSMFYDSVNDVVKIYTGTGSTSDGYVTVGAQSAPAAGGGGGASDDIEYLVVAGGGGGAIQHGGGGGAGGYLSSSLASVTSGSSFSVIVGSGGAGGAYSGGNASGANGVDSSIAGASISTITATGGGGGSSYATQTVPGDGGSGGGGGNQTSGAQTGGSGTTGQGNDGGDGATSSTNYPSGGGGGAGAVGGNGSAGVGGNGGIGKQSSITGNATYYAGGGGSATYNGGTPGTGGLGGGATGVSALNTNGNAGTANTGGGGSGGNGSEGYSGGNGGSGVVILAYSTGSITAQGGIKTTRSDGQFVHTFKESGTLTVGDSGSYTVAPSENFNIVTYTGNGSTQAITGVGFQPDLIWIKGRDFADNHNIGDSTRGPAKYIFPNLTSVEFSSTNYFTSFDSDGFTLGSDGTSNSNNNTFVAWCWKAGLSATLSSTTSTDIFTATSDNCSDTGDYIIGTKTYDFTTPTYVKGAYSYSVYGASARSSNITIQWSDDNSNWVTAYSTTMDNGDPVGCGIVNSGNYATETDANVLSIGKHRYWRYVEGSAITGHHPRVSRIGLYVPNYTDIVNKNTDAGFSIVEWEGTGTQTQIPHGLSAAPELIFSKRLDSTNNWSVYHKDLSLSHSTYPNWLYLNANSSEQDSVSSANHPYYARPSATVIYQNTGTSESTNVSGGDYISYCFHSVAGYSKIGTYSGNGTTQTITTGFKPAWVVIKATDNSSTYTSWVIFDTQRATAYNDTNILYANTNTAEGARGNGSGDGDVLEIISTATGFKLGDASRTNNSDEMNDSNRTYLYWAISE